MIVVFGGGGRLDCGVGIDDDDDDGVSFFSWEKRRVDRKRIYIDRLVSQPQTCIYLERFQVTI